MSRHSPGAFKPLKAAEICRRILPLLILFSIENAIATITLKGQGVAIALEGLAAALSATTRDGKEGPAAVREKRAAKFVGR
jgi:hypothetical protein